MATKDEQAARAVEGLQGFAAALHVLKRAAETERAAQLSVAEVKGLLFGIDLLRSEE